MTSLFEPIEVGNQTLANRVVMAPLTRNRADSEGVPQDIAVEYYRQRAGVGLIVTEGTQPSAVGQGYLNTPGIHTEAQREGWRAVFDAVHAEGGHIVVQLMHAGRIAHNDNRAVTDIVAPSPIAAPGQMITATGPQDYPTPRALGIDEIPGVVAEFVHAARTAVEAGADGVEIHGANGYLIHQFLAPSSNDRTDSYGGTPANRARFAIEVVTAVAGAIGADRVGLRISPSHNIQGVIEDDEADTTATYRAFVDAIRPLGLAYLSYLADPRAALTRDLRTRFGGPVVANDGFGEVTTRESAQALLDEDLADLVAVGRPVLANPDLVRRWRTGAELNEPNSDTFYGGGAEGYTDYPPLPAEAA
ncbi:alkene reductase [uncultured Jatrophihabitans sp.]|uniref:alkene reductase n=1 Tax=uncultured Jatrophihabitans sp. TaxID=1610747 RepID=UPI0035CB64A2